MWNSINLWNFVAILLLPSSVAVGNCNGNWTEFSLIITVQPTHPPTNLNLKYLGKGKATSIFRQMDDNLNYYLEWNWAAHVNRKMPIFIYGPNKKLCQCTRNPLWTVVWRSLTIQTNFFNRWNKNVQERYEKTAVPTPEHKCLSSKQALPPGGEVPWKKHHLQSNSKTVKQSDKYLYWPNM
jgi:hypothetical protein